jgi:hypothetical protein
MLAFKAKSSLTSSDKLCEGAWSVRGENLQEINGLAWTSHPNSACPSPHRNLAIGQWAAAISEACTDDCSYVTVRELLVKH